MNLTFSNYNLLKLSSGLLLSCSTFLLLSACQTVPSQNTFGNSAIDRDTLKPNRLKSFNIDGKIGFTNKDKNQSGSAFYVWIQEQERFSIDMQGALGIGYTHIEYNGKTASLTNSKVGNITTNSPEELLTKATGFTAPISQLPYWISGLPAPTDSAHSLDQTNRLATAKNGGWLAKFSYKGNSNLPRKLTVIHTNKNKVIITINHKNK